MPRLTLPALAAAALLAACAATPAPMPMSAPLQDGAVPLPASYRTWPKFLADILRPDLKQVREIYVNPTGTRAQAGQAFAQGTTFVMENYAVQTDAAGQPVKGAGGKLVKGNLLRVFVMSKGRGFGSAAEPQNGEWAYAVYDAAGNKSAENLSACRTCHLPLAPKDFVFRTDEYFAARAKGGY